MTTVRARNRGRGIVAAFAVTQTIGYGTLYYAFAVFLTPLSADLDASTTAVTGAYTVSVLTGALLAVPVGRWLDRHGGRALMTAGSLAGTLLLVAWAHVDTLGQLYLVQAGIGVATAASLYEAAMAIVVTWFDAGHRSQALLAVTIVAGLASSIFLPLTGWLTSTLGWRHALLVLAAIQAVTVPLHALAVRRPPVPAEAAATGPAVHGVVRAALRDRAFWLLTVGFTANVAALSAVAVHLVAALIAWGHSATFAATTAGLLGVLSVTGRLVTTGLQRRFHAASITAVVFAVQAVAAAVLPVAGAAAVGAVVCVVVFGLGFGVGTIAKPVLLAQRYDVSRYATLAGVMVVPMTVAKAAAPLGAAALATQQGGYRLVFAMVGVCVAAGAAAIAATRVLPAYAEMLGALLRRVRS